MEGGATMIQGLEKLAARQLPRMLTQVCRDPGSPFFGSWDRNWWHYKIRDFSSIILQQGGYAMALAAELPMGTRLGEAGLRSIAAATVRFWNQRALRHGAFEEYYPYEQGYPPVAFSSLAVAKIGLKGIVPLSDIRDGLKIAAGQLLHRFEPEAANQQVAGTAAVAAIRKLAPDLVDETLFQSLLDRTLALQHDEGWFPEYDGPDLGYLAVTLDCLWDIHDHTGDPRVRAALENGFRFIAWFVLSPLHCAGMHNSRNTDYFVPYAIARLASTPGPLQDQARQVFEVLFKDADSPAHFLAPTDDRYWCHYIGQSVFRALTVWKEAVVESPQMDALPSTALHGSGHQILSDDNLSVLVSSRKGGILTGSWGGTAEVSDFGWIIRRGGKEYVTHWWTKNWQVTLGENSTKAEGKVVSHKEHTSTPGKHAILRLVSFLFGCKLIRTLKSILIFKKSDTEIHFSREIRLLNGQIVISDQLQGLQESDVIHRAPRASKRHVASADSFHPEDFNLLKGVHVQEQPDRSTTSFKCLTQYSAEKKY
jgi:hypothetical protein